MAKEFESTFATRLSPEELARLVQLRDKGTPLSEIARTFGKPEAMIRMALRRAAHKNAPQGSSRG